MYCVEIRGYNGKYDSRILSQFFFEDPEKAKELYQIKYKMAIKGIVGKALGCNLLVSFFKIETED